MASEAPFVLLTVLDGFGCRNEKEWNAIAQAEKPNLRRLFGENPWTTVEASGERVGLPAGQMGNSEVGHLNIGAGRVVDQDIVRISKAARSGAMKQNPVLVDSFERLKRTGKAIHIDRPALGWRGALAPGASQGLIDAAVATGWASAPSRCRACSSTRSSTGATRPRARRSRSSSGCWPSSPTSRRCGSRRSSGATTRWTATSGGSGSSADTTS